MSDTAREMKGALNYSLENLHDIVLPQTPSYLPSTTGAWLFFLLLTILIVLLILFWRQYQKQRAYRYLALILLDNAATAHDVSVILKRVALVSYPREQVASLHGEAWIAFLAQKCNNCQFEQLSNSGEEQAAESALIKSAKYWVKHHSHSHSAREVSG